MRNADERFLGRDRAELRSVAKETLEGTLRGVLATLTPEEVNEDRLKFAESLRDDGGIEQRQRSLAVTGRAAARMHLSLAEIDEGPQRSRVIRIENRRCEATRLDGTWGIGK